MVDQMLQNSTKKFYAFNKRTISIQRIIHILNEIIILIQPIICISNEKIVFIQWITLYSTNYLSIQRWTNIFLHVPRFRIFLSSLQNPRLTNLVPKFSTRFLVPSTKFILQEYILFQRPSILLRKVFIIWYSHRTNFFKIDFVSQYT